MKRTAKRCLYLLMICTTVAGMVQAQDESSGTARVSDAPGPLPTEAAPVYNAPAGPPNGFFNMTPVETWFAPRFYVDSRAGVLYGYQESFTNLGGFVPYFFEENAMLYADARGMLGYDGRGGANLGLGWRYYMPELDRFIGANLWYDFDASHTRSYNQVGVGFESIGRYFDLFLNGYIPVGGDQNILSTALVGQGQFSGNMLLLDRYNEVESAYTGFDAQIGGPMPIFGRYGLQGYTGFYFFTNSNAGDFTGVSGRLAWQVNEDWNIAVNFSDDHTFGTNTQMQISMTLPDGKPSRWLRPLSVRERMMKSTQRNYRVTVEHDIQVVQEAAINPKDGNPYFIVHVDPNVAGNGVNAGSGTVEDPYNQLTQFDQLAFTDKSAVDIIFVKPRTDGSSINLDDGVTLLTGQRLLSNSVAHTFEVAQNPGVLYPLGDVVPGQALPVLSNTTGGNVVTFADGAVMIEVSGFTINGSATGSGIVGTNNSMININNNVIQNGRNGIALTNLTGFGSAMDASYITNNIIRNNTLDGINISNSGVGPLDLVIANNAPTAIDYDGILDTDTDGDGVNDTSAPDSLDGDGDFSNDGILANGDDGIDINLDAGSRMNLLLTQNRIGGQIVDDTAMTTTNAGNGGNGVEIDLTANSSLYARISGNTPGTSPVNYGISNNGGDGVRISADNSTIDMLNQVADTGITALQTMGGGFLDNTISGNAGNGVTILGSNSDISAGFFGNSIGAPEVLDDVGNDLTDTTLGNGGIGIAIAMNNGNGLFAIGAADIPATPTTPEVINGNDLSYNDVGGIELLGSGNALISYNIENNRIRNVQSNNIAAPMAQATFSFNGISGTDPFTITNQSDTGIDISQVTWNLNGTPSFFDSDNAALNTFIGLPLNNYLGALIPVAPTDITTGLATVNNVGIIQGSNPLLVAATNVPVGPQVIVDNSQVLNLSFNDFNPTESFGATTILSQNTAPLVNDSPFSSAATAGSTVQVTFSNGLSTLFRLDLDSPTGVGVSGMGQAFGQVTPGFGTGNDGIHVAASGNATFNQAVIQNNSVRGYGGYGINVEATGLSDIPNLVVLNNTLEFNGTGTVDGVPVQTGGGLNISRDGSAAITALVQGNSISNNFTNGFDINTAGTAVGLTDITLLQNTISNNNGDGVNVLATENSRLNLTSQENTVTFNNENNWNIRTTDDVIFNFTMLDDTANNALGNAANGSGNGVVLNLGGTSVNNIQISGTSTNASMFALNTGSGFALSAVENALVNVNIQDSLFDTNSTDGLNFSREGASLILAQLDNLTVTNNLDDGIQFYASGSDRSDPNTPLFNGTQSPANRLVVTNTLIADNGLIGAENGGNGLEFATFADADFVSVVRSSIISGSATDGARIFSTGISSYGLANDRSTFDNVMITDNGRDGIKLFAMGAFESTPEMFVEVNSDTGVTLISDNGDDGIQASVPYGSIDLNVIGTAGSDYTTIIQHNGLVSNTDGHGIEFNVADTAIDGDDAGDTGTANNGERTDGDADGAANEILNFYFANGFEFTGTNGYNGFGTLNIQETLIGDGNRNDSLDLGNAGDGVHVFNSNVWNLVGGGNDNIGIGGTLTFAGPLVDAQGNPLVAPGAVNDHDVNRDLIVDGAFGAGNISRDFIVDQAGVMVLNIDNSSLSGNGRDGLNIISDGNNGTFDPGNLVSAVVTDSLIADNGRHGVNIDLEGKHGAYDVSFGPGGTYTVSQANLFIFDNNTIERNNNYGFRYQANAGIQARPNFSQNADTFFWGQQFQDGVQPTNPTQPFDPAFIANNTILSSIFNTTTFLVAGSLDSEYYSIATDLNSRLVFNNNTVQFNGQPNQLFNEGGDGMFIRVSTDSYLSADIGGAAGSGNGNTFTGNAISDLRFESFTATWVNGLTSPVPDPATAGATTTPDQLYLDDTAQLTLRFNNNIGRELAADAIIVGGAQTVGQRTAAYALNGTRFIDRTANGLRQTQMFQVDDYLNLNTNNSFSGVDLVSEFLGSGGWYGVTGADPAFPNPIFPQNAVESFGNPFFP